MRSLWLFAIVVALLITPATAEAQSYEQGRNDWQRVLIWFDRSMTPSFEAGADYWAANRNTSGHYTCERTAKRHSSEDDAATMFFGGCMAAKALLDPIDVRRSS